MTVYPIEISEKLRQRLQIPSVDTESKPSSESAQKELTNSIECNWVEAIEAIEAGEKASAYSLLIDIESINNSSLESMVKKDLLSKLEQIIIACYAERLLLKPINYLADTKLVSSLRKIQQQLPVKRLKARLAHALAIVMLWRRDSKKAIEFLLDARENYTQLNEQVGEAIIADTLGNVFNSMADHQQALLYYSESLALKTQLADIKGQAITLGNLARLCLQLGRYQQAEKFAKLDLALCKTEPANIRARLLNLLARINIASGNWQVAKNYLSEAIELHDNSDVEGIFFCHKDLLLLKLEQGKSVSVDKLIPLQQYLSNLSPYHQIHFDFLRHKVECNSGTLEYEEVEKTLVNIQSNNLPELEIDFRIWFSNTAFEEQQFGVAKSQLLLARKLAKKFGFKRFMAKISSLMLRHDIHEYISEELHRPIVETVEQVGDGYLIRKLLGKGGFGSVYLAHDMLADRDVALKQFHRQDHWDLNEFQILWNQARLEFEAIASLKHPAVVETYALGHDNFGAPYIVQEFLSGGELRNLMLTPQTLSQVLTYLIPVVQGLAAIHQAGVIHRDIKPENILLNAQGMPVIVDFGIARLKQSSKNNDRILGTLDYMAPEQLESASIDHRADLFSIGCILFEWLSGKTPNASTSKKGALGEWLSSGPKYDFNQEKLGEATELLRSLLHKNPAKRPKDALELLAKLKALKV